MRKRLFVLVLLVGLPLASARSAEPKALALAEELVDLMNTEGNLAQLREQYGQMMALNVNKIEVPPEMQNRLAAHQEKLMKLLYDSLSYRNLRPGYVEVYTTVFTSDELQGLLEFYRTPVGRTYAKKLPLLSSRLLDVPQSRVQDLTPTFQRMTLEFTEELKKEAAVQGENPPPGN